MTNSDVGQFDYQYDDENQLTAMSFFEDTRLEFVYDGKGRMRKYKELFWVDGFWVSYAETWFIYDGMRVIQERNGTATHPW